MAGGVGTPGGEGVEYSPILPVISATMPAKGARSSVCSSSALATSRLALACSSLALPPSQRAALASALATARSAASLDTSFRSTNLVRRWASRRSEDAAIHCPSRSRRAEVTAAPASATLALRSRFHRVISSCPRSTWSPSATSNWSIWPPMGSERRERWQASTVPARVLAAVFSTVPRATVTRLTSTLSGRVTRYRVSPSTSTTAAAINQPLMSRSVINVLHPQGYYKVTLQSAPLPAFTCRPYRRRIVGETDS